MRGNLEEMSCILYFLRASGYGEIVDDGYLLLLAANVHLTRDLQDLLLKAKMSPARHRACDRLFEEVKRVITEVATAPEDRVTASGERSGLHIFKCGSLAFDTALYDSDVEITLLQRVDSSPDYFLRRQLDDEDAQNSTPIDGLMRAQIANTEAHILLPYPACFYLALPLMGEHDLLISIRDVVLDQLELQEKQNVASCNNGPDTVRLHSVPDGIGLNITVNRTEAFEVAAVLPRLLKANKSVYPVIIFMKVVLKQFKVQSSQLNSYVLTLMVLAFARFCSYASPLPSFTYYPHQREEVEPGHLLFCFLSFFSPLPRGQFDPTRMSLVPIHPRGVVYETDEGTPLSQLNTDGNRVLWRVLEPTHCGDNAAASCVLIDDCRDLFERILVVLLQSYAGDVFAFFAAVHDPPAQIVATVDSDEAPTTEQSFSENQLISRLLQDWWIERQSESE
ncbi:hypothetical protein TraAM80_01705 [Trypanosoma rangeli]|uniref:Uncharacterized protein n=1 Tax=Trypanosoma rangeli TaxID=5698 RepID=A0A422NY27_TRYRA|nr:uncharacterized protein TraAM80_01705 [Trypanosoma rangeli]RNF10345.1 hypothetical protein TraAM80_01705 [Trypanosoma rangeli]|eukprot:RNF10345.1 hypothetical protein TraAM80_01705 [Trypanosoma rangeli]